MTSMFSQLSLSVLKLRPIRFPKYAKHSIPSLLSLLYPFNNGVTLSQLTHRVKKVGNGTRIALIYTAPQRNRVPDRGSLGERS
jgi:hypothetical protein